MFLQINEPNTDRMHIQEDDRPVAIFALSEKVNRRPRGELGCQTG